MLLSDRNFRGRWTLHWRRLRFGHNRGGPFGRLGRSSHLLNRLGLRSLGLQLLWLSLFGRSNFRLSLFELDRCGLG